MDRVMLSGREYAGLQTLFAMVSAYTAGLGALEKRGELAGCWEDLQRVGTLAQECLDKVLLTIPNKKLMQIRTELENIRLHIKIEPEWAISKVRGFSYVPTDTLNNLLNHLCQTECLLCNKTAVQARKCPHRKTIEDALPHTVEGKERESCKFSDMVLGLSD